MLNTIALVSAYRLITPEDTLFGNQSYCKPSTVGRRHLFFLRNYILWDPQSSPSILSPINLITSLPSIYTVSPLSKPLIFFLPPTCSHVSPLLTEYYPRALYYLVFFSFSPPNSFPVTYSTLSLRPPHLQPNPTYTVF